jgi:benzoate-CoA ligase
MAAFESFGRGVVGLREDDIVFSVVRLSTAYGLGTGLLFPLAAGAEAVLLPEQPTSEALFAVIESLDPTVLFATPSVYGQLARDAEATGLEQPLARLRMCVSGAEGMPPKLIPKVRDVLGADVTVGYNLTEAFQFVLAGSAESGIHGACGSPVPGFAARVVDDAGEPAGPNVIGTLQIRGKTVLSSYWGETVSSDQFVDGWFTTRDRFMCDESGVYYHCGRDDDWFKVGGKWVSPTEVERALLANEAVWECAVIGAEDEDGLIKPFAFVVPNIGHEPNDDLGKSLREYVKEELAPYKYPRWVEFVDQIPKGPNGKILRYKLRASRRPRRAETAGPL